VLRGAVSVAGPDGVVPARATLARQRSAASAFRRRRAPAPAAPRNSAVTRCGKKPEHGLARRAEA